MSAILKILMLVGPPYFSWIFLAAVLFPANYFPVMQSFKGK